MHIKRENGEMVMSSLILCENYSDTNHFNSTFIKVDDNEYRCMYCKTIMVVKEPVLVHDDIGRLKIQVSAKPKQ